MEKTLFVLLGPTGVGKTERSLQIAERLGTPILNADSRQLFRDLPIGTAAPTAIQQSRVKHYFVGTLGLEAYYSAAQYEGEVLQVLEQEFAQRDNVLLTGGSMLYIDAVCKGIDDIPTISEAVRLSLKERYEKEGHERLAQELQLVDPDYYAVADLRNPKRIVHALEVYYESGQPYSSFRTATPRQRPFRIVKIGLNRPRPELFERINSRVTQMIADGLIEEARRVLPYRHCNALNTVGYKEMFRYLDGEWTLDLAMEKIRRNSRVYAKKQLTWFAHDPAIHWFHPDAEKEITDFVDQCATSSV